MKLGLQLLIAFLLVGGSGFPTDSAGSPQRIDVVAKRFAFVPNEITVKRGEKLIIAVRSEDANHGLKFKDLGATVNVPKGKTVEMSITPMTPGTYVGVCSQFCGRGHGEMKFVLKVTD